MKVNIKRSWRFWAFIGGIFVVAATCTALIVLESRQKAEDKKLLETHNKAVLKQATQFAEPADNDGKADYFATLGSAYYKSGEYEKALDNFLKADSYIDKQKPENGSVNANIARVYKALGNKEKAREYIQLEIDRLKNTDNEDVIQVLTNMRDSL